MGKPKTDGDTLDAFHQGGFWLVQPGREGHRAGMDAMVLAASAPPRFSGLAADLGAGAGAAGLALASRCDQARVTLVERDGRMAGYARRSVELDQNADLKDRVEVIEADVTLAGKERSKAGLTDRSFDFVMMNPPFNSRADRQSPDRMRRDAHVMDDGLLDAWLRTAVAIAKSGARFSIIARPASLGAILDGCRGRFGALELKPVQPDPDGPAIRIVIRGIKGSRAALSIHPPLCLHDQPGAGFSVLADDICNGRAALFGD